MQMDTNLKIATPYEPWQPPALLTLGLIRKYYVPLGERTLHRWISAGRFPRADIVIGGKVRMWRRETVETWIGAQERSV